MWLWDVRGLLREIGLAIRGWLVKLVPPRLLLMRDKALLTPCARGKRECFLEGSAVEVWYALLFRNLWLTVAVAAAVSAADSYANAKRQIWGDWLAAGLFTYYGVHCAQNFIRCREVHCAITAPGFLAAAVLMFVRVTGVVHFGYGMPWIVFAASACAGYCVQSLYKAKTGSIFLKP